MNEIPIATFKFKVFKFPPFFVIKMGDLLYIDSILEGKNEIDQAEYDKIIKSIKEVK